MNGEKVKFDRTKRIDKTEEWIDKKKFYKMEWKRLGKNHIVGYDNEGKECSSVYCSGIENFLETRYNNANPYIKQFYPGYLYSISTSFEERLPIPPVISFKALDVGFTALAGGALEFIIFRYLLLKVASPIALITNLALACLCYKVYKYEPERDLEVLLKQEGFSIPENKYDPKFKSYERKSSDELER